MRHSVAMNRLFVTCTEIRDDIISGQIVDEGSLRDTKMARTFILEMPRNNIEWSDENEVGQEAEREVADELLKSICCCH